MGMADREDMLHRARHLLESETTLALATVGEDAAPAVAALYYWSDEGLRLYWLSSPESRHSRNLVHVPRVAVSVHAAASRWEEIRGVQMEGLAEVLADGSEQSAVIPAYRAKFGLGAEMDGAIAASSVYVFRPSWVRYLDNAMGFGFKFEAAL
jgi:uncharacterized protein